MGAACAAVLALAVVPPAAEASATAPCTTWAGSVTSAGEHTFKAINATAPPSLTRSSTTAGVYGPGQVRLATHFEDYPKSGAGSTRSGYVVIGDVLYQSSYAVDGADKVEAPGPRLRRIGSGWSNFSLIEVAPYNSGAVAPRTELYGLRKDGLLFRWHLVDNGWRSTGSYPGFSAVKTMTLISKQPTYDTFLANTRGGALYTVRIPVTSPMKPVVNPVRTKTWQVFETLTATKCGNYGTLLLGIDKQTKTGHLYAVGHANGPATVIKGLGQVSTTFPAPLDFRWTPPTFQDNLNGD
ncbi:hypothetical protein [Kribbella sp. CA-247076]|uniref:hypothetical protein n=1 Tax=Kribbella sp. CA-247076 TaxID=3239941 RepID=UPI003D92D46D